MDEKVCVATYAINLNKPDFIKELVTMIQDWDSSEKHPIDFHLEYGQPIHMAQEACALYAIGKRCTHLLFVEDDTTKIPKGALRRLLDHDKDVVGAFAYARRYPHYSMIFRKIEEQKDMPWLGQEIPATVLIDPDGGLKKVDMLPWQFTLMKTSVFQKISGPWFFYCDRSHRLTDFWFADKCSEAGIELYCDTDLIVEHAGINGENAGFFVQMEMSKGWGGTDGHWKSGSIMPLMRYSGFEVSNEAMERHRQKKGFVQ